MLMKLFTAATVICSALAFQPPEVLAAQAPSAVLSGSVTDTAGRPLVNALVILVGTSHKVLTSREGRYEFSSIPDGVYTVRAHYLGFQRSERDSVRIVQGTTSRADFRLRPQLCDLDCNPITVQAKPQKPRR